MTDTNKCKVDNDGENTHSWFFNGQGNYRVCFKCNLKQKLDWIDWSPDRSEEM